MACPHCVQYCGFIAWYVLIVYSICGFIAWHVPIVYSICGFMGSYVPMVKKNVDAVYGRVDLLPANVAVNFLIKRQFVEKRWANSMMD